MSTRETDPLITHYLPILRGHIVTKYRWLETRGNCLVTIDDLVQIAAIALFKLAAEWDSILAKKGKTREGNNGLFWSFLVLNVKRDVLGYYEKEGHAGWNEKDNESFDVPAGGFEDGESWAEVKTSLQQKHDSATWDIIHEDLVDFFSTLPQKDKTFIALRYFDHLNHTAAASVVGLSAGRLSTQTKAIADRWRDYARNQFTDHTVVIGRRIERDWEPPESLFTYLRDRHRKDLAEYLGYVTICFRADPVYLTEVLNTKRVPIGESSLIRLSPFQQHQADEMLRAGVSMTKTARELGVSLTAVRNHAKRAVAS